MAISTYLSIITSNACGLNSPVKRHVVAEWITKYDPIKLSLHIKKHTRTESNGMEKILHESGNKIKQKSWGSNAYTRPNRF